MQDLRALAGLAAVALLAVGLAGCADKPGVSVPTDGLEPTPDTGIIRGIVVSDAIVPIEGAKVEVAVDGTPRATTTSAAGAFGFAGLPTGTYFLKASKLGYEDVQQSVEVVAGVADPSPAKILLTARPGDLPSFEVLSFSGFLECNVAVPLFFLPCHDPVTGQPIGNDDFEMEWNLTTDADFVHVSLVWEPTQPVGTELYMNVVEPGAYEVVAFGGGKSPLVLDVNATALEPVNEAGLIGVEVSGNGEMGIAGGSLQQPFDAYVVVFRNFAPAADYAFWKDGAPKVPA